MFQCFTWGGANFFPILSFKFDPSKRWQSSADCKLAPNRFWCWRSIRNLDANAGFFGIDLLFLFWMCLVGDVSRDSTMVNHHLGFFPGIQQANVYKRLTPKNANPTLCKGTAKVRVMTTWATGEGSMCFVQQFVGIKNGYPHRKPTNVPWKSNGWKTFATFLGGSGNFF